MSESEDVEQVLELFSGIGGMHYALKKMGSGFRVATAIDISDVANRGLYA